MPSLRSLLDAIAHPIALVENGRVTIANAALRARLEREVEGTPAADLAVPGLRACESALEDGTIVVSFVADDAGAPLEQLSTEDVARLLVRERREAVSITDATTGLFVDVNDAWVEQYGYSREEAIGRMGPCDVSAEPDATSRSIAERAAGRGERAELRWHRRRDGTVFPVEVECGSLVVGGRPLVYAQLRNVEERVRAEEALRRSEETFRTLIEGLPHAVFVHRDERILYVNAAARKLLGLSLDDDLTGTPLFDLVHPDDRALAAGRVRGKLYRGEAAPPVEERLIRRDGSVVPVEVVGIPTLFDGQPAGLAIAQDITARREMEARLVVSDRLASLGRLAASVGHEINNPLMYVLGSLELLRQDLSCADVPPVVFERIDAAQQGTLRVRDVVRDLRALARTTEEEEDGPSELSRTLATCVQMAGRELRHRARLVVEDVPRVWVRGSEARLGQVFLNLLVNAAQSIEEGSIDENEVRVRAVLDDGEVIVEVLDTGRGLPVGRESQIFEPFFTTKRGSGMGLGLSICHSILSSLGGRIEAERRSPRGTCFRVRIPLAEPEPIAESPEPDAPALYAGRRILVVDDEPDVLELLRGWLGGYEVRTAASGREAIQRFEEEGPFDAVLCDLMMGDLTGMDVHAQLAGVIGEGRLLFMTGGPYTERARRFLEERGITPLHKPFRRDEVLRAIARALETPAG